MDKKRIVTSLDKISPEIKKMIAEKYPLGWSNNVLRINKPSGEFFHAIPLETPDIFYMIKVPVKIDSKAELEKEESKMEMSHQQSEEEEEKNSESETTEEAFSE
jgi:hypothetical protein